MARAFAIAPDDCRTVCKAFGRKAQRRHGGELRLGMSPRTHAGASMAAEPQGMSLNAWIEEAMRRTARLDLGEV